MPAFTDTRDHRKAQGAGGVCCAGQNGGNMPAFAAHEIFGEEALQETKGKLNEVVAKHPEVFRLGCQGPDLFFFNPFMKLVHRKVDLGSRLHTSQINRFFEVFLDELLKLSNKQGLEIGISYFLGFVSHYTLDTELHPYIYARSGYRDGVKDSGARSFPAHQRLEAVIDQKILMVKKGIMPSGYYPEKRIRVSEAELSVIARLMSRTLQRIYHLMIFDENIKASYRCMRGVIRHVYDHSGRKRQHVRQFEAVVLGRPVIANMMVADRMPDRRDAMNTLGRMWTSPWNPKEHFDKSVWEMYDIAMERYQDYYTRLEPLLAGLLRRIRFVEQKKSRAGSIEQFIREQIAKVAAGLENRDYHSGKNK